MDMQEDSDFGLQQLFITCIQCSSCSKFLYVGTSQGYVLQIDTQSGYEIAIEKVCNNPIKNLYIFPEGDRFLAVSENAEICLIDTNTFEIVSLLFKPFSSVRSISSSSNKRFIIINEEDYSHSAKSGFHITTFLDYHSLSQRAMLLFNSLNDFGFIMEDSNYEVTDRFMAENYLVSGLEIIQDIEEFLKKSTTGLFLNFIKTL